MFEKHDAALRAWSGSTLIEMVASCSPTIDDRIGCFGKIFQHFSFWSKEQSTSPNLNGRSFSLLKFLTFAGLLVSVRGQGVETPTSQLQLSSLNGTNGFFLNGGSTSESSGNSVSFAGDVNGDGLADFLIGAHTASPSGKFKAGHTYVIFGKKGLGATGAIDLSRLNGINGMTITGASSADLSGYSVSDAGDVNGDGVSDILIGAPHADSSGRFDAGKTYVVFGSKTIGMSLTMGLSSLNGANGVALLGEQTSDESGFSVSKAGDVNGDGITDILIGAYNSDQSGMSDDGRAYVIFGSRSLGSYRTMRLSSLNGTNGFVINGAQANDYFGYSVSYAGDVNGDKIDDILVGAPYASRAGIPSVGMTYVIFGGVTLGRNGTMTLSNLDGTNGFVIHGQRAGDNSGYAVAYAGDVNGDGYADILIGSPKAAPGGRSNSGITYLVFGTQSIVSNGIFKLSSFMGTKGFTLNGKGANEQSGSSVAHAGDLNGDGIDDFLIGAPQASPYNRTQAGRAYVIFGSKSIGSIGSNDLSSLNGKNGYALLGEKAYDQSGTTVSSAGDVNGDGIDDVIIGAPMSSRSMIDAGTTYVIFGKNVSQTSSLTITAKQLTIISQLSTGTQALPYTSLIDSMPTKGRKSSTLSDTDLMLSSNSRTSNIQAIASTTYTTSIDQISSLPLISLPQSFDQNLLIGLSVGGGVLVLGCSILGGCLFITKKKSTPEEHLEDKPPAEPFYADAPPIDDVDDKKADPPTNYQGMPPRPVGTHYETFDVE